MDAGISRGVPMADCFAILRQAPALVLSLGLNDTVAKDALCLARAHKADALFVKADVSVRTHALKHIVVLGAPKLSGCCGDMVNGNLCLRTGKFIRAVQVLQLAPTTRRRRRELFETEERLTRLYGSATAVKRLRQIGVNGGERLRLRQSPSARRRLCVFISPRRRGVYSTTTAVLSTDDHGR